MCARHLTVFGAGDFDRVLLFVAEPERDVLLTAKIGDFVIKIYRVL
jgi:hypothetical protein